MRKCSECGAEVPDDKLAYDKVQDFFLCEYCYCNFYIEKMTVLKKIPGYNYINAYNAAKAMFLLTKSLNPLPLQDTPKTDTEGTPPPSQQQASPSKPQA